MGNTREYQFINGPETSTLPSIGEPTVDTDTINLGYANNHYVMGRAPVADVTAIKALLATGTYPRQDGEIVVAKATNAAYVFDAGNSETGDDLFVLTPTVGTGRWLRISENPALSAGYLLKSDANGKTVVSGVTIDASNNVVIPGTLEVQGSTTFLNTTNTTIEDKLITLNKGGGAASATASGIEFEENSVITAYIKTSADRNNFEFLSPNTAGVISLPGQASSDTIALLGAGQTMAFGLGAVGTPSITFLGDLNTGLYSSLANTLDVATDGVRRMTFSPTGKTAIGAYVFDVTNPEQLLVHQSDASVNVITAHANYNSYSQINMKNASSGANASSDVVVTADNGNETTNYVDMGINGSAYSVGTWTINGADDGYLYAQSSNLSIGTAAAKYLSFFTGGTLAANERMRIDSTGRVGIGTTSFSGTAHVFKVASASTSTGLTGFLSSFENTDATNTGDTTLRFAVNAQNWYMGIDNSDSDAFKLGVAADYATYILAVTTGGFLGIGRTPSSLIHFAATGNIVGTDSGGSSGNMLTFNAYYSSGFKANTTGNRASVIEQGNSGVLIKASTGTQTADNALSTFNTYAEFGMGATDAVRFSTAGSSRMKIDTNGDIDLGIRAVGYGKVTIVGTYIAPTAVASSLGGLFIASSDAVAADKGGVISLGGVYTGTTDTRYAAIAGLKDNATDNQYGGYMALYTRANGAAPAERMRISSAGYVGINTTSATSLLEVRNAPSSTSSITVIGDSDNSRYSSYGNTTPGFQGIGYAGTYDSPTASAQNQTLVLIGGRGYGTSFTGTKGQMLIAAAELWTATSNPTYITFGTTPSASTSLAERMRIDSAGYVGIGITPTNLLHVSGSVASTDLVTFQKSTATTTFTSDYSQLSLYNNNNTTNSYNSIWFYGNNSSSSKQGYAAIGSIFTTPTASSEAGALALYTRTGGGAVIERLRIEGSGRIYASSAIQRALGSTPDSTSTTTCYIEAGTFTSTITNGSNVTSTGTLTMHWQRIGNIVTCGFQCSSIIATSGATVQTQFDFTLPIAAAYTAGTNLNGHAVIYPGGTTTQAVATVYGISSSGLKARLDYIALNTTNSGVFGVLTYLVQ